MTNIRGRVLSILLVLILVFTVSNIYASDHRLEDLDINVYLNDDGSARIREKRIANLVEGTESYIVIGNLGKSRIIDFKVYEDGQAFQVIDNWDISASREEKTGKNGIINTSDGYELAWGIGQYGRHEYTLEYTITNFIKQLEDSQIILWEFVNDNTNIPPEKVRLVIESDYKFSPENERIWAFGFDGNIDFDDGKIVAVANGPLNPENYVTILTRLPQGLYATGDILDKNFEEIRERAFVGSDYDEGAYQEGGNIDNVYGESGGGSSFFRFIPFISIGIAIFVFIVSLIVSASSKLVNLHPNKFKKKYKEEYYRDYPYHGDFLDIYYIPYIMGVANFENLLTGFILKWIKEERIVTVEEEVGWIFKKDETNIKFLNKNISEHTLEGELFHMMLVAAGKNEILEEREFTKWARSNVTKLNTWEKKVKENSIEKVEELGYIDVFEKRVLFFKTEKYELTEEGRELETNIYKYINYLNDFSLLNEHEAVNVMIWDNIMIWAGFLGLTEEVSKQFNKLYPRYGEETVYRGNSIYLSHNLASNISQAKVSSSSSSGGGGSSSMGGGGGSFGGGSGGGTR